MFNIVTLTSPDTEQETAYGAPPVARAFTLLRHIAAGNRCRNISHAAKATGINRTTLIRLLATLEDEKMIEAIPDDGGYRLGTGLITLAAEALHGRAIAQVALPFLAELVRELHLSAHLGILEGREIVYLARVTPNSHLASNVREGTRLPAHATTIGRVLLADLPVAEVRARYAGIPLEAYSERTRTTLADLEAQLAEDRTLGIAWSMANFEPEIGSAAALVRDHRGQAAGAVNVTGHASVFAPESPRLAEIEAALAKAARGISEALGYRE
ncbi:IclR family transcriptional regulator [Ruixingdingia sedimenti]|uniref:IclR family transcriptional regulator n=1 Tax=Ruixingdingia sedimenti TaxID=3073604 RepID=A0ABU1FBE1_9RHOB|nr:IclR family transcriptional regulator [Xinfangfangia sp. LG-4]MDR5654207.1 IclR family transcriptional regulator [Xinfangfangia sp. LG-4]